jgi:hypothetical protein
MKNDNILDPSMLPFPSMPPQLQKLYERYLEGALDSQERSRVEEDERKRDLEEKFRRQQMISAKRLEEIEKQIKKEQLHQENCPHSIPHPLGKTHSLIGAMRLGNGMFTARCQACGKQWTDPKEIKPNLYPRRDWIGGPDY